VTERIAPAQAEERPKSSDENTGSQSALQNGTLLAASISLMKEENWERQSKGKGVPQPTQLERGTRKGKEGPNWAQYKRLERLAKHFQQSRPVSRKPNMRSLTP